MGRFTPILKKINDQLDVPQPEKSRIMIEIAADLEEMYQHYLGEGLDEEQAFKKTSGTLALSNHSIRELSELHLKGVRRWMAGFGPGVLERWEKILLIFVVSMILATGLYMTMEMPFFSDASIFAGPVYMLFGVAIILALIKVYRLYIRRDHDLKRIYDHMSLLLLLSGAILFSGTFGYYLEFMLARSRVFIYGPLYFLLTLITGDQNVAPELLMGWLISSTSMMVITLMAAIITALIWFILYLKISRIEAAELAVLLEDKITNL
jgi:hypothetical protein